MLRSFFAVLAAALLLATLGSCSRSMSGNGDSGLKLDVAVPTEAEAQQRAEAAITAETYDEELERLRAELATER